MAKLHQQVELIESVGFKRVQLFKKKTLGIGSYGKVCKAKCDDLPCAAKLMHETLFDPALQYLVVQQREHRLPIRRFEKECGYLNTIRHPNIVQCLCIFEDPDTGLPVLLMELMDGNLTRYLDTSRSPILYHVQVNICHDVTLALSYLHSNGIVHRDLSSNNVLLIGNIRAKLSDFGMAKLSDVSHQATHQSTFTMCPGTDVYMPPESVDDKPAYTEKIDCFSFGVIIVQILTQQFPKPGDRNKIIEIYHPQVQGRKVRVSIPEIERRQNHISKVDPNHPLLQVALDCLKDRYDERPSAQHLCERIIALKETPQYDNSDNAAKGRNKPVQSSRAERDRDLKSLREQHAQEIQSLQQAIKSREEKDLIMSKIIAERDDDILQKDEKIATGQQEIQHLRQQLQQCIKETQQVRRENEQLIWEKEKQLGRLNQQLEVSEHARADFERRFHELEQQLCQESQPRMKLPGVSSDTEHKTTSAIKMRWTKGKRAPCKMSTSITATLQNSVVYFKPPGEIVYAYSISTFTWSQLPLCPTDECPLVSVNDLLTLIGGYHIDQCINKLFSLTGQGSGRKWTQEFPSMPTKRFGMAALCAGIALIVAGGVGEEGAVLTIVEVLNTESNQWSTAANLPEPLLYSLATVCDGQVYMLGGENGGWEPTKSVYACKLTALLKSTNPRSIAVRLKGTLTRPNKASVWSQVADLPATYPSCVFLHGSLLAIGGRDSDNKPTTAVHMYKSTTNSWEAISHMTTPRYSCFAAVLPDNQLMIVGGITDKSQTKTDTVEMGSLLKLVIS